MDHALRSKGTPKAPESKGSHASSELQPPDCTLARQKRLRIGLWQSTDAGAWLCLCVTKAANVLQNQVLGGGVEGASSPPLAGCAGSFPGN